MASIITIVIKGISICYLKEIEGNLVWRILFPFNECHSVRFGYEKGGSRYFVGHLGKAKGKVEITSDMALGSANSTEQFDKQVLDLTSDTVEIKTHHRLALRDKWDERGIVLTIPGVVFDVRTRLSEFPINQNLDIFLENLDGSPKQKIVDLAYSITGKIRLAAGKTLSVRTPSDTIFTTAPDIDHTLIFDNDCKEIIKNADGTFKNDMEMNYSLVEEPSYSNRKFVVNAVEREDLDEAEKSVISSILGGFGDDQTHVEPPPGASIIVPVEPALILQGKPCLVVKVTDPESLQTFP